MDELDLLKNSWKKSQNNYPKYNDTDLYKMLHKKSTSIVKWILIISIIEFLILNLLNIFIDDSGEDNYILENKIDYLFIALEYLNYIVIIGFVYTFYKNFKKINVSDNLKKLMANILYVKKITNLYIIYNLTMITVVLIIYLVASMLYNPVLIEASPIKAKSLGYFIFFGLFYAVFIVLFVGVFYLIYKLIYGRLIKKLVNNYEELKKLEI